jgi:hypothetical protein
MVRDEIEGGMAGMRFCAQLLKARRWRMVKG